MQESLELLEWPAVHERLLAACWTPYGERLWAADPFLPDEEAIWQHLAEVEALKTLLVRYGEPIIDHPIQDLTPGLMRIAKGGTLIESDLRDWMRSLGCARSLVNHLLKHWTKESATQEALASLLSEVLPPDEELEILGRYVAADGSLLDNASPTLGGLRRKLQAKRTELSQRMNSYLTHPTFGPALQSPVVTEREGRSVLPVKVEFKSVIPGIVHSGSASGATLFVEPQGVIDLNNEIQRTLSEIAREIQRILQEVSALLGERSEFVATFLDQLAQIDKRLAAARMSIQLQAHPPSRPEGDHLLALKQVRHPLLMYQFLDKGIRDLGAVVPNDIRLGQDTVRTLLITGPNTGGKTVLLKTVGLCAVMLRAGLHLPAAEGSTMSLLDPVLIDVGDQQSISQNLSTFSAHLEMLKKFVSDETNLSRGLVLIDEIGAGTDPAEGAALARAVLDELYEKGALTIVTTHLGELKVEAHQHTGYMNASMTFDPDSLSPTYRLALGIPGTSNAITIAQRLGLKPKVIEKARSALSQPVRESAELIESLEQKNRKAHDAMQEAEAFRLAAKESYEQLELQRQQFQEERRKILQQFKLSLKTRLTPLEDEMTQLKAELQAAEKTEARNLSGRLKRMRQRADGVFEDAMADVEADEPTLTLADLAVGEEVKSRRLNLRATVVELLKTSDEVILVAGNLRVNVPVSDVEKLWQPKSKKKKPAAPAPAPRMGKVPEIRDASTECDVRGMRVEEALEKVQGFLDQAALAGFERVGIIHGQGTGALKKAIRDYLRQSPFVTKYYPEEPQFGGDGKTLIEL
jgi:DNA mismatch repair protein MutS2